MHAKSLQSCLTVCNPVECSLPGSSLPWDSPVKNIGGGCHALLQGIFPTQGKPPWAPQLEESPENPPSSRAEGLLFLHGLQSNPGSSLQTEDCHFLLQGIFPAQRSNPSFLRLLRWQVGSLSLCHLGSPVRFRAKQNILIWT